VILILSLEVSEGKPGDPEMITYPVYSSGTTSKIDSLKEGLFL
jgi:hypothetical protein